MIKINDMVQVVETEDELEDAYVWSGAKGKVIAIHGEIAEIEYTEKEDQLSAKREGGNLIALEDLIKL